MKESLDAKANGMHKLWYVVLLPLLVGGFGYGVYRLTRTSEQPAAEPQQVFTKGEPVVTNLGSEIEGGFQGDVHPILHGQTKLALTAHWDKVANGNYVSEMMPPAMCAYILTLEPEIPQQEYSQADFSAFLPQEVVLAGQSWTLDPSQVVTFLKQFRSTASMQLVAQGRRFGPDGAFAVMRGVSSTHLDIAFRVHAEFDITPTIWNEPFPGPDQVWYTPSYFSGQMIVNRESGTVEYFRMALATEATLNVHITASHTQRTMDSHDIVRVDRMELVGGDVEAGSETVWSDEISAQAAHQQLKRAFYKFAEINWLPFEQVKAAARENNQPIFAMVLWGNLDDQSC